MVVYNKIDRMPAGDLEALRRRHPNAVYVSGLTGEGIDGLLTRIAEEASRGGTTMTVLVPYTRGDLIALAHERAQIVTERHHEDGTQLIVKLPAGLVATFEEFAVDDESDGAGEE